MTITEMQKRKRELGYSFVQIAELTGLPLGTVQKVLGGYVKSPRRATVVALERVLGRPENASAGAVTQNSGSRYTYQVSSDTPGMLDEKRMQYYTTNTPGGMHEIGVRKDSMNEPAFPGTVPPVVHQLISVKLAALLLECAPGTDSVVLTAPHLVYLSEEVVSPVAPDISVYRDRSKLKSKLCEGAPDLIVEILSDATRHEDQFYKLSRYETAGVREYWMVDPAYQRIVVYDFSKEVNPTIYGFGDEIPVGILGENAKIPFAQVAEYAKSEP